MNKLSFLLCSTALAATFAATAGGASAGTIIDIYSPVSYGPAATPITGHVLTLAGYTASGGLGTLTGVSVELIDNVSGTFTATNTNPDSGPLTLTSGYLENILSIGSQPANLALPTIYDASANTGGHSVAYGTPYVNSSLTGTQSATSSATGDLSDFLGGWSITVSDAGYNGSIVDSGITVGSVNNGQVTLDVTYTYTPYTTVNTPEPMSLALLGVGLAGVGVIRRRRSKT